MPVKPSGNEKRREKRYSTGSTASKYLRPSLGSCHDFCKYGNKKEEALPDIRSVTSHARMMMTLSGGRGSEGEIPLMGIIKDEPTADKMNSAAELRKKAASSLLPKSTMRNVPTSSPRALKPKSTRTPPSLPSKSGALLAKVKPMVTVVMRKSIGPLMDSTAPTKVQKKNKAEPGGDNKGGVQGEELYSNDRKDEEEALELTDYHSMPSFSEPQENRSSCKFSDFTKSDELDATDVEDEAGMNRSAEDACRAKKPNFRREKVNGLPSLIHCPTRRLRFRGHSDDDECEDSGNLSEPGSMKAALRHWHLQEKKVATRLLNDIIEETAAKLGRTQKRKVKALVGAFETVISLQDVNSSASIGK